MPQNLESPGKFPCVEYAEQNNIRLRKRKFQALIDRRRNICEVERVANVMEENASSGILLWNTLPYILCVADVLRLVSDENNAH
mmetsp:Transcript_13282/g.27888  ORF Transcript_13282/g.27888 Transcript_13282/m.27888 type:complete len:84 (-) Transcript_13282:182-433(-)